MNDTVTYSWEEYHKLFEEKKQLKAELDKYKLALTPIKEWYGGGTEGSRADIEILTDAIADLQKDRKEVLQLTAKNERLRASHNTANELLISQQRRHHAEIADCRTILERNLDRDKDPGDSLRDLIVVLCNALFWARWRKKRRRSNFNWSFVYGIVFCIAVWAILVWIFN